LPKEDIDITNFTTLYYVTWFDLHTVVGKLIWTPLHCAAYHRCCSTVGALLKCDTNAKERDGAGKTALMQVFEFELKDIVRILASTSPEPRVHNNGNINKDHLKASLEDSSPADLMNLMTSLNDLPMAEMIMME
jgi:hypothetical protein